MIKNEKELAKLIDLSCVKTDITIDELKKMVKLAKQYKFICCFAMPCFTPWLIDALKDETEVMVGGTVGFPSGADLTSTKMQAAKEFVKMGCDELDMVINVGALKSGLYNDVYDDIKAVRDIAGEKPLKTIIEVAYLTDTEIQKASEIAVKAGAAFVKTGTGWAASPTTVEHIRLIKKTIGNSAYIKAAGGIRNLSIIEAMIKEGCSRFGIGINSIIRIMDEIKNRNELQTK